MIDEQPCKRQLLQSLLQAAPTFRERWREYLQSWDGEFPGYFNAMSELASFVVDSFASKDVAWFPSFFGVVERFLEHGGPGVREILVAGLIEDIQNLASHEGHGFEVFAVWLGPVSTRAWEQLAEDYRSAGLESKPEALIELASDVQNPELKKWLLTNYRRSGSREEPDEQ